MDTRADPLGVCIHRSSFIDARIPVNPSRLSSSKKTNAVDSSKKDMDFGQTVPCSAGNVQGNVLHIAGSIIDGSTSTIWPNTDRSSTALIPPKLFTLAKRSRSCNDLIETSATVTRTYSQKSGALRTRGANISWTNNLRETHVDGRSSDSKPHKLPDLPHHGPNHSKFTKEDNYKPSQETRDVKTQMVHDRFSQLEKDETEPTQVLLGLSPTIQPMNESHVSTAFSRTSIETNGTEKEDEEIFLAVRSKTTKQGTEDIGTLIYARSVVDDAGVLSQPVTPKASPSKFDDSEWSSVQWDFTIFTPQSNPPSNFIGVDTSRYTERSDGQVDIRPKPRKSAASSSNSLDMSEDLSHLDISASPFVSALHKFNEIVPNCDSKKIRPDIDAMERFQRDPTKCLGNTKKKGMRCCSPNRSKDRQKIEDLLTELAAMNFEKNTQRCVDELSKLIEMAVCSCQREKVQKGVSLLVRPDPLPIRVKVEELPGHTLIRDERRTTEGQEVQAVVSPVIHLTRNITYWLRKPSTTTLVYLPDYRPYRTDKFRLSDVRGWVIKQAETPLTALERKAGYLYVYWNQATFGVSKIGYSGDVTKRLRRWERQCKHIAEEQYRSPIEVRNVRRLERLVHAELKKYRVEEECCRGCSRNHQEWFKGVDLKIIRESIEFWTKWLMKEQGQYEEVNGKWLLKEDAKKELPQLCTRLSVAKAEESKVKSITITPQRYNLRPRVAKRSSSHKNRGH